MHSPTRHQTKRVYKDWYNLKRMGDIKMNLFFLHKVAGKCAEDLCDKHIPKMVLETAQMLSTAHHYHNSVHKNSVYKRAYENHPTTKWVRQNCRTYEFAYRLFLDLLQSILNDSIKYTNATHLENSLQSILVQTEIGLSHHNVCQTNTSAMIQ